MFKKVTIETFRFFFLAEPILSLVLLRLAPVLGHVALERLDHDDDRHTSPIPVNTPVAVRALVTRNDVVDLTVALNTKYTCNREHFMVRARTIV